MEKPTLEITVSDAVKIESIVEVRGKRTRQISLSLTQEEYEILLKIGYRLKEPSLQKVLRILILNNKN